MHPDVVLALLAGVAACGPPLQPLPAGCFEERQSLAQAPFYVDKVDLLLVIDDSAAMAPIAADLTGRWHQLIDRVAGSLSTTAPFSLRVGVVAASGGALVAPPSCPPPRGAPWAEADDVPSARALSATVACMAAVGASGPDGPLLFDAAHAALDGNAAFHRWDAFLMIVFASASDDRSAALRAFEPSAYLVGVTGGTCGAPTPRLDAAIAAARGHHTPLCGGDLGDSVFGSIICSCGSTFACVVRGVLPDPGAPDCSVEDTTRDAKGASSTVEIPRCDRVAGRPPCWRVVVEPRCASVSPQSLRFVVERDLPHAPEHTETWARCTYACD